MARGNSRPGPPPAPGEAVAAARRAAGFLEAVAAVLARADAALPPADSACRACGQCCHFDRAGHRLYVTTGELALLTAGPPAVADPPPLRCSYQRDTACTARPRRPLGCRVFFCRPAAPDRRAGPEVYEPAHRALRALHERFGVPYLYVELTAALADIPTGGT